MYWTLELVSWLDDAPWPATKDELIDYAIRSGAPLEVIENLQELGVPEETLRNLWDNFEPQTDAERGVYAGKPAPLTPEQLAQYGLTPEDIENMSPSQLREFLASL